MNHEPKRMRAAAIDRFGGPEVLATRWMPVADLDQIAGSFELAYAAKAHERLAARHVLGKIVLGGR
jgi:hypothetical protein